MKEFLSVRGKRIVVQLIAGILLTWIVFIVYDKGYLITGVIAGYLLAAICAWIMAYRTWRAAHLNVKKAKIQMWISLIMRLVIIFIFFRAAAMQSLELFFTVIGGFFFAFIVYMLNLTLFVYYKNRE